MGIAERIITYWSDGTIKYTSFENRIVASGYNSIRRTDLDLLNWSDFIYHDELYNPNLTVFQDELYVNNISGGSKLWKVNPSFTDLVLVCDSYGSELKDIKVVNDRLYSIIPEGEVLRLNDDKNGWITLYTFPSGENPTCLTVLNNRLYIGTSLGRLYRLTESEDNVELICPTLSWYTNVMKLSTCFNNIYGVIYNDNYLFRVDLESNIWILEGSTSSAINTIKEYHNAIYLGCNYGILNLFYEGSITTVLNTFGHIRDIIVFNNRLYISEGEIYGHLSLYQAIGNVSFYASNTSGYVPLETTFYISSEDTDFPITTYYWDFGTGSYSNEREPVYTYTQKGFYTVSLTVSDGYEERTFSIENYITALDYLRVIYNGNGHTGGSVPVDPNLYLSGQTAIILPPGDMVKENSVFLNWNTEADGSGLSFYPDDIVYLYYDDLIFYAIWRENSTGGLIGSNYDENKVTNSYWDIEVSEQNDSAGGEGKNTLEMKKIPTFISWNFENVWRIVEDETYPQFLIADFSANKVTGNAPLEVNFINLCSLWPDENSIFVEREWDFGDGHVSNELHPTHIYQDVGKYTVSLRERRNFIEVYRVKEDFITVTGLLVNFVGEPREGYTFLTVQFKDLSIGTFDSWLWDFGDGRISTQKNPVHFYRHPGVYTVKLSVTGTEGTFTVTKENYIIIKSKVTFDIAPEPDKKAYLWGTGIINKGKIGIELKRFFR